MCYNKLARQLAALYFKKTSQGISCFRDVFFKKTDGNANGKTIRVLQFSLSENIGGIETFLRNLYKQFDHDEVQFDFVTTYNSPVYESEFLQGGSRIFRVPSAKRIFAYRHALNKLMAENKYDVVHINKNSAADLIPFTAARRAGIPIVIAHAHNTKSTVGKFADILNCINRGKMDKYLTTAFASSNAAAEWMFGKGYCRANKVPILRNGIDISDFSYSEEKARGNKKAPFPFRKSWL